VNRARRSAAVIGGFVVLFAAVAAFGNRLGQPLRSLALPLAYSAQIRAAARGEGLDPALVAAVIYAETRFTPRRSAAGAVGPMQVEPATAAFIAQATGWPRPSVAALAAPELNIRYGTWYLHYLLGRYGGARVAALAAYNAGTAAVDRWLQAAGGSGRAQGLGWLRFGQTRAYVETVLSTVRAYRQTYAGQLGG